MLVKWRRPQLTALDALEPPHAAAPGLSFSAELPRTQVILASTIASVTSALHANTTALSVSICSLEAAYKVRRASFSSPGLAGAMSQVKQEPGSTPFIKPDPDSKETSLGAMSDDDLYEDAGDLDFSNAAQDVWLTRIPKSLWEHWAHLDDDEEIQIGTVRVEGRPEDTKRVGFQI